MDSNWFIEKYKQYGSVKAVHRNENISYRKARTLYHEALSQGLIQALPVGAKPKELIKDPEPLFEGRIRAIETAPYTLPKEGEIKRYLFTSAQNNTPLHDDFWNNLIVLAEFYDAQIHIGRFSYVKSGLGAKGDKDLWNRQPKHSIQKNDSTHDVYVWDKRIEPYVHDQRWEVAPGLVWCGEWQKLPTAVNPLAGYESYTGRKSGVFPHSKLAMDSIASNKFEPTKFNYTTGTVTHRNYIQKGAGLKAEFHHCYGALLVEVDSDGNWFTRQINGDSEGTIYDLDKRIHKGELSVGHRVKAINWGDTHVIRLDSIVDKLMEDMLNTLNPEYQFLHDVLDFRGRNHHELKNPFKMFQRFVENEDDVESEVRRTMAYIEQLVKKYPNTETVVVNSNHDQALERWLREADWRRDPKNMKFFMQSTLALLEGIKQGKHVNLLEHWYATYCGYPYNSSLFLDEDESFIICEDANGGIECGMHGHLGPNGSRGGFRAFAKMGRKANVGHSHSAGIFEGVYTAGTSSVLDMEYNRGPSSWSHSHIVTYPNGKRAIITMWNGKWRA